MAKILNAQLRGRKAFVGNRVVAFDVEGVAEMDEEQAAIVLPLKGYRQHEVEPVDTDEGTADGDSETGDGDGDVDSEETSPEVTGEETPPEVTEETTEESAALDRVVHFDEKSLGTPETNPEAETPVEVVPAGEGQGVAQDDSKQSATATPTISRTPVSVEKQHQKGKRGGRRGKKSNA